MDLDEFKAYLTAKLDQLHAAAQHRDGDAAKAVIESIIADGHPEVADRLTRLAIAQGLRRQADILADYSTPTQEPER